MNSEPTSFWIEKGLVLLCGIYVTLYGYQIVGHKPGKNLKYDAWIRKHGWLFRIGGPLVILSGLLTTIIHVLREP